MKIIYMLLCLFCISNLNAGSFYFSLYYRQPIPQPVVTIQSQPVVMYYPYVYIQPIYYPKYVHPIYVHPHRR